MKPKLSFDMQTQGLISIIIVTRNAAGTLQRCLDSIYEQTYPFIEIIVMDGRSRDGTVDMLLKNSAKIAFWKSEKDDGIYDAMNKALGHVRGKWIYFLGADDVLMPGFSIFAAALKEPSAIYYGSVWKSGEKYLGKLSAYQQAKTGINHQAIIYPASVFGVLRFDTSYPISADHVFNMGCYSAKKYQFRFIDQIIANFNDTGISSLEKDALFEKRKSSLILRHYGLMIYLRFLFKLLKRGAPE